ncbi:MAG: SAM-dependent methyltransferase [Ignavibacteria bacterium]|nr:SAM-dependent methyltransferase [Ignavibacteria bacterium]
MDFIFKDIGVVHNERNERIDDNWGNVISEIILNEEIPSEAVNNLIEFSHIEVIYFFHLINENEELNFKRIPRGLENLYPVGIFSQRASKRPNKIGNSICELLDVKNKKIIVKGLDAMNNSPVIDIKPVYSCFLPDKSRIIEPEWVKIITKNYW